jgi:hypothetical protein
MKKNIIVTNPSKTDLKQKEQVTAKILCYDLQTKDANNDNLLLLFLQYDDISHRVSCLDVR